MVYNYPLQPRPEDVAGVLALFMGGENHDAYSYEAVMNQGALEIRNNIRSVFRTSRGLAFLLYMHEEHLITLSIGHADEQDITKFLSNRKFSKNLSCRKGDGEWFRQVSPAVAMREAVNIAVRSGFEMPNILDIDECCTELIRHRWNFDNGISFVDAVEKGMRDARRITSRRHLDLSAVSP